MAGRRRKKTSDDSPLFFVALTVLVLAGIVVFDLVREHPVISGSVALLVTAGGTLGGITRKRRRDREAQRLEQIRFVQSLEIERYHAMGAAEFEHALAFLCTRDGCARVRVVGRAGDLGADVIGFTPDGRKIVLQAKRYGPATKVTGPDLQRFGGTCFSVHRAAVAMVVTTSTFTKQAREYAAHMGIRLVDEHALVAWASRTGPAPWN